MKYFPILLSIIFLILACSKNVVITSDTEIGDPIQHANKLHNSNLIVRVPTQSKKIKYYESLLSNKSLSEKVKINYAKLNEGFRVQDSIYFENLAIGFNRYYTFSSIYYVQDTDFKLFIEGSREVFVRPHFDENQILECECNEYYIMTVERETNQFILTNSNLQKLQAPFPHKKSTFLSSFKKIIDLNTYIHNQIKWFNENLFKLSKLKQN